MSDPDDFENDDDDDNGEPIEMAHGQQAVTSPKFEGEDADGSADANGALDDRSSIPLDGVESDAVALDKRSDDLGETGQEQCSDNARTEANADADADGTNPASRAPPMADIENDTHSIAEHRGTSPANADPVSVKEEDKQNDSGDEEGGYSDDDEFYEEDDFEEESANLNATATLSKGDRTLASCDSRDEDTPDSEDTTEAPAKSQPQSPANSASGCSQENKAARSAALDRSASQASVSQASASRSRSRSPASSRSGSRAGSDAGSDSESDAGDVSMAGGSLDIPYDDGGDAVSVHSGSEDGK